MSGSEGPDYGAFSSGGGAGNCAGINRTKSLESPDETILSTLSVGDVLALVLHDSTQPVISVVTASGEEAGAIIPELSLIECLRLGVKYIATVTAINGGHVLLRVQSA